MMVKRFALAGLFNREDGQTMSEYAVVLGTIVLAVIGIIGIISTSIVARFGNVASVIKGLAP
jgi:Flp pilus assembly pilin Flp